MLTLIDYTRTLKLGVCVETGRTEKVNNFTVDWNHLYDVEDITAFGRLFLHKVAMISL